MRGERKWRHEEPGPLGACFRVHLLRPSSPALVPTKGTEAQHSSAVGGCGGEGGRWGGWGGPAPAVQPLVSVAFAPPLRMRRLPDISLRRSTAPYLSSPVWLPPVPTPHLLLTPAVKAGSSVAEEFRGWTRP